jgi:hypothetical protein
VFKNGAYTCYCKHTFRSFKEIKAHAEIEHLSLPLPCPLAVCARAGPFTNVAVHFDHVHLRTAEAQARSDEITVLSSALRPAWDLVLPKLNHPPDLPSQLAISSVQSTTGICLNASSSGHVSGYSHQDISVPFVMTTQVRIPKFGPFKRGFTAPPLELPLNAHPKRNIPPCSGSSSSVKLTFKASSKRMGYSDYADSAENTAMDEHEDEDERPKYEFDDLPDWSSIERRGQDGKVFWWLPLSNGTPVDARAKWLRTRRFRRKLEILASTPTTSTVPTRTVGHQPPTSPLLEEGVSGPPGVLVGKEDRVPMVPRRSTGYDQYEQVVQ